MEQLTPLEFHTAHEFSLGPMSLFFARGVASCFAGKDKEDLECLRHIRKIQLGVYEIADNTDGFLAGHPNIYGKGLNLTGWELFVRARDGDDLALLYFKMKKDKISALSVVAISREAVAIVEMEGDLRELIHKAIQEKGIDMDARSI